MHKIALDAAAGHVSAELLRRGIAAATLVRVVVEVPETGDLPMAALAQAGVAFDFLAAEPELYTDADLVQQGR